ncbi:sensor histidine kinase [Streptomyces sp. H51]|uniref:sensor histidine kinase n=1 Tax=Streptomyces sp. H51 TaxID=3111770 RepID=UPI002D769D4B|nr:ATP-binding protein [Streptomyces sp. H51]
MTAPAAPSAQSPLRTVLPVTLLTAAVAAVAIVWAVSAAPSSVRGPLGWCSAVAAVVLCAAVAVAARERQAVRAARARLRASDSERERAAQEQERLAARWRQEQQRLVDAADAERVRLREEFARERARLAQEADAEHARLAEEARQLSARLDRAVAERAAAISATANTAARMQALSTGMLADLRAMEERHSDEDVLTDLLHLDHRTAQAGRLADSIAVLTGARTGRRWARPIGMESILRGAMGRISGYQRIRLHSASDTAVAGHAAEGVMHALAELLDNAANFSPPNAEVHVYVEEVPAGVIVSVEDSGLVMSDVQLRRAEHAVSGDSADLGGLTGTRLGLAVVGRLSRKYGLKVSFRPSARGGTGVLMLVPQEILTNAAVEPRPVPAERPAAVPARTARQPLAHSAADDAPAPARTHAASAPVSAPVHETPDRAGDEATAGLPKRRRGRTLAAAERARSATSSVERPAGAAEDIRTRAARFGDFRQAVRAAGPEATARPDAGRPHPDARAMPSASAETASDRPFHSHAHPEGDTTS